jgi:hypothetical protein
MRTGVMDLVKELHVITKNAAPTIHGGGGGGDYVQMAHVSKKQ